MIHAENGNKTRGEGWGGALTRNLGRGVRPTQGNPDLVQDTKMQILLPSLRESES